MSRTAVKVMSLVVILCASILEVPAAVSEYVIRNVAGTIDPITYTDATGTFTTSIITVSDSDIPSTGSIDMLTGFSSNRMHITVSFHNGKPGGQGANLVGRADLVEQGVMAPGNSPSCAAFPGVEMCGKLDIVQGVLVGAGIFNGTVLRGKNPTLKNGGLTWTFRQAPPDVFADLPAGTFTNGNNVALLGDMTADLVMTRSVSALPGSAMVTLCLLLAGAGIHFLRRRVRAGS
jgi:hypothetical protein